MGASQATKGGTLLCFLTHRRLKPGSYEQFRRAWEPDWSTIPGTSHVYHVRNTENEDEIISFGLWDGSPEEMESMNQDDAFQRNQEQRQQAMAEFVEWTGVDAVFEVIEDFER